MKNNVNGLAGINQGKSSYCGKARLSKQRGSLSKLLLLFVICGLGYSAFLAKNKGLITADGVQSFVSQFSDRVSNKMGASNSFSGYGVQLMATQQLDQATSVMNDFARDGYSAFVVKSKAKGRTLYKVRLGPYSHRPEAIAVQDKVVRRYPSSPYVKTSLVIYKPN